MVINHLIIDMPFDEIFFVMIRERKIVFYLRDNHTFEYRHFGMEIKRKITVNIGK
jgi:hypothetical protein